VQVVFVIGGATWSEVQAAHELSSGVEVFLGSTNLLEGGNAFLEQLASLTARDAASLLTDAGDM
jgi:Sec1 family